MEVQKQHHNNVIFFDGVCGLCNGFVDFVMAIDKEQKFKFSPLQSDYARNALPSQMTSDLTSVVFLQDGKTYTKSRAVIRVLKDMGGLWKLAVIGNFPPEQVLNKAYDLVAANRYKIFGKKDSCRIPTPEERSRFVI